MGLISNESYEKVVFDVNLQVRQKFEGKFAVFCNIAVVFVFFRHFFFVFTQC